MRVIAAALTGCLAVGACANSILDPPLQDSEVRLVDIRVLDGDSLIADVDGAETEIRLVGVNAPERDECHGAAARAALAGLLDADAVTAEWSDFGSDDFGRRLAYLSRDGVDVNAILVEQGHALAIQNGHRRESEYKTLEEAAALAGLGMWAAEACGGGPPPDVVIAELAVDPTGPDSERLEEEWITLTNAGGVEVALGRFVVRDESTRNRYRIPDSVVLGAGESVRVRTGCGTDSATDLHWCSDVPVWSNGGDTVLLLDPAGTVVDRVTYDGD